MKKLFWRLFEFENYLKLGATLANIFETLIAAAYLRLMVDLESHMQFLRYSVLVFKNE